MPERTTRYQKKRNIQSDQIKSKVVSKATPQRQSRPSPRTPQRPEPVQQEQQRIQERVDEQPVVQSKDLLTGRTIEQDQLGVDEESDSYKEGWQGVAEGLYAPTQQITQMPKDIIEGVPVEQQAMRPTWLDLVIQPAIAPLVAAPSLGLTDKQWYSPIGYFDNPALPEFLQTNQDKRGFIEGMSDNLGIIQDTVSNPAYGQMLQEGIPDYGIMGYKQAEKAFRQYPGYYLASVVGDIPYFAIAPAKAVQAVTLSAKVAATATRVTGKVALNPNYIVSISKLKSAGTSVAKAINKEQSAIDANKLDNSVNTKPIDKGLKQLEETVDLKIKQKEKVVDELNKLLPEQGKGVSYKGTRLDIPVSERIVKLSDEIDELKQTKKETRDAYDMAKSDIAYKQKQYNRLQDTSSLEKLKDARSEFNSFAFNKIQSPMARNFTEEQSGILKHYDDLKDRNFAKNNAKMNDLRKQINKIKREPNYKLTRNEERRVGRLEQKIDQLKADQDSLPKVAELANKIELAPDKAKSWLRNKFGKRYSTLGDDLQDTDVKQLSGVSLALRNFNEGVGAFYNRQPKELVESLDVLREPVFVMEMKGTPSTKLAIGPATGGASTEIQSSIMELSQVRKRKPADDAPSYQKKLWQKEYEKQSGDLSEVIQKYQATGDDAIKLDQMDLPKGTVLTTTQNFMEALQKSTDDVVVSVQMRKPAISLEKIGKDEYFGSLGKERDIVIKKMDSRVADYLLQSTQQQAKGRIGKKGKGKEWVAEVRSPEQVPEHYFVGTKGGAQGRVEVLIPKGASAKDVEQLIFAYGLEGMPRMSVFRIKKVKDATYVAATAKKKAYWRKKSGEEIEAVPEVLEESVKIPMKKLDKKKAGDTKHPIDYEVQYGKGTLSGDEEVLLYEGGPTVNVQNTMINRGVLMGDLSPDNIMRKVDALRVSKNKLNERIAENNRAIDDYERTYGGQEIFWKAQRVDKEAYGTKGVLALEDMPTVKLTGGAIVNKPPAQFRKGKFNPFVESEELKMQKLRVEQIQADKAKLVKQTRPELARLSREISVLEVKLGGKKTKDLAVLKKELEETEGVIDELQYGGHPALDNAYTQKNNMERYRWEKAQTDGAITQSQLDQYYEIDRMRQKNINSLEAFEQQKETIRKTNVGESYAGKVEDGTTEMDIAQQYDPNALEKMPMAEIDNYGGLPKPSFVDVDSKLNQLTGQIDELEKELVDLKKLKDIDNVNFVYKQERISAVEDLLSLNKDYKSKLETAKFKASKDVDQLAEETTFSGPKTKIGELKSRLLAQKGKLEVKRKEIKEKTQKMNNDLYEGQLSTKYRSKTLLDDKGEKVGTEFGDESVLNIEFEGSWTKGADGLDYTPMDRATLRLEGATGQYGAKTVYNIMRNIEMKEHFRLQKIQDRYNVVQDNIDLGRKRQHAQGMKIENKKIRSRVEQIDKEIKVKEKEFDKFEDTYEKLKKIPASVGINKGTEIRFRLSALAEEGRETGSFQYFETKTGFKYRVEQTFESPTDADKFVELNDKLLDLKSSKYVEDGQIVTGTKKKQMISEIESEIGKPSAGGKEGTGLFKNVKTQVVEVVENEKGVSFKPITDERQILEIFNTKTIAGAKIRMNRLLKSTVGDSIPTPKGIGTEKTVGQKIKTLSATALYGIKRKVSDVQSDVSRWTPGHKMVVTKGGKYEPYTTDARFVEPATEIMWEKERWAGQGADTGFRLSALIFSSEDLVLTQGVKGTKVPKNVRLATQVKVAYAVEPEPQTTSSIKAYERVVQKIDEVDYVPAMKQLDKETKVIDAWMSHEDTIRGRGGASDFFVERQRFNLAKQYYMNIEGATEEGAIRSATIASKSGKDGALSVEFTEIVKRLTPENFRRPSRIEKVRAKKLWYKKGEYMEPGQLDLKVDGTGKVTKTGFINLEALGTGTADSVWQRTGGSGLSEKLVSGVSKAFGFEVPISKVDPRDTLYRKIYLRELKEKNPWVKLDRKDQKLYDEGTRPMTAQEESILKMNIQEMEGGLKDTVRDTRTVTSSKVQGAIGNERVPGYSGLGERVSTDAQVQSYIRADLEQKYNASFKDMLSSGTRKYYENKLDNLKVEESNIIQEQVKRGGSKTTLGRRDDVFTKLESDLDSNRASQSQIASLLDEDESVKKRINTKYYEKVEYKQGMTRGPNYLYDYAPVVAPTTLSTSLIPQAFGEEFQETLKQDPKPLFNLGMDIRQQQSQEQPQIIRPIEEVSIQQARDVIQGLKPIQTQDLGTDLGQKARQVEYTAMKLDLGLKSTTDTLLEGAQAYKTSTIYALGSTVKPPTLRLQTPTAKPTITIPRRPVGLPMPFIPPYLDSLLSEEEKERNKKRKKKKQAWEVPDQWWKSGYWQKKKDPVSGKWEELGSGYRTFTGREPKKYRKGWDTQKPLPDKLF